MDEGSKLFDFANRKDRRLHQLDNSQGLYALFLKSGSRFPDFELPSECLIYIGKADSGGGLKKRCHFNGRTRKHSPRKSLASVLEAHLDLKIRPFLNSKDQSYDTWGLESESEDNLKDWMRRNINLSVAICRDANTLEKPLIKRMAPVLNLTDCVQTQIHQRIRALRGNCEERAREMVDKSR